MSRPAINFLLDCWLFVNFLFVLGTAAIVQLVFPGRAAPEEYLLWGLTADQWQRLSFGGLCTMALSVVLHVLMHWTWVCGFVAHRIARMRGQKASHNSAINTLYGVTLLIACLVLLGGLLLAADLSLKTVAGS